MKKSKKSKTKHSQPENDEMAIESDHVVTRSQSRRLAEKTVPQLEEEILGKHRGKGSKKVKQLPVEKTLEEQKSTLMVAEPQTRPSRSNSKTFKDIPKELQTLKESLMNEPASHSVNYKQIAIDLQSDDECKVLEAVSRLSAGLSIAQGDDLGGSHLEILIPELLNCLDREEIPDIMVQASLSIVHILDLLPQAAGILIINEGVPVLCQKIQNFEYIDVAENAIRALEKISIEHGTAILYAKGLEIMINMIDFFVSSTQKSIMSIISNTFRTIADEQALTDCIIPALPSLIEFLSVDPGRSDTFVMMFSRLIDKIVRVCGDDFDKKRKHLEAAAGDRLIRSLCFALAQNLENFGQFRMVQTENILRTLNRLCYHSTKLCMDAFSTGLNSIIEQIFKILDGSCGRIAQTSVLAYETISLINSILALRTAPLPLVGKIASFVGIKILENSRVTERLNLFKKDRHIADELTEKIAKRLPSIYDSNQTPLYKYLVLICLEKLLSHVEDNDLKHLIDSKLLSSFLSKISESNDIMIITLNLQIIEIISPKLPQILIPLAREGLIEFINNLAETDAAQKLEGYFFSNKRLVAPSVNTNAQTVLPSKASNPSNVAQVLKENNMDSRTDTVLNKFKTMIQKLGVNVLSSLSLSKKASVSMDILNPLINYVDNQHSNSLQGERSNNESRWTIADDRSMNDESEDFATKDAVLKGNNLLNYLRKQSYDSQSHNRDQLQIPTIEKSISQQTNITKAEIENNAGNKTPIAQIRLEICEYAKEIQRTIELVADKANIDLSLTRYTLRDFILISESLVKNSSKRDEFGIYIFQTLAEFINQNIRITNYELKQSHLIQSLIFFILDGTVDTKSIENRHITSTSDFIDEREEQKTNQIGVVEAQSMNEGTCALILGRIIAFLAAFKIESSVNPNTTVLSTLVSNLQEILSSDDKLCQDPTVAFSESENTILTDFKLLATKTKFKIQFIRNDDISDNGNKIRLSPSGAKKIHDLQFGLHQYKEEVLAENLIVTVCIEMFETLETVEDYILNKLNSGDSAMNIEEKIFEKRLYKNSVLEKTLEYSADRMEDEDEEEGNSEDRSYEMVEEEAKQSEKSGNSFKNISNSSSKSTILAGDGDRQTTENTLITEIEMDKKRDTDKKRWSEKFAGKKIDFKKHLRVKFFANGVEISSSKTIFEICYKYRSNFNLQQLSSNDNFTIDYKICYRNEKWKADADSNLKNPTSALLCDEKQVIKRLLNKLERIEFEDYNLMLTIQFLTFVSELRHIDDQILTKGSLFTELISKLSSDPHMKKCIEGYKAESVRAEPVAKHLVSAKALENAKLSALLNKITDDPIVLAAGMIPDSLSTIAVNADFLLELDSRIKYAKFGNGLANRALHHIYQANRAKSKDLENLRVGKLNKFKISVQRENVLEEAISNIELYSAEKSIIEFEFQNDEGTGLGPTLEYYSIIGEEIQNPVHKLWRKNDSNLLFPYPIDLKELEAIQSKKKLRKKDQEKAKDLKRYEMLFQCAGTLAARAIIDERVIDLPFHPVFWDLILERPVHVDDIARIDKQLGDTLIGLREIVKQKRRIEDDLTLTLEEKTTRFAELKFKGCSIEDLALNFTFPGHEEIELFDKGAEITVELANLEQYITTLTQYYLIETNKLQVLAFREGFNKVLPLKCLHSLRSDEIEYLVSGGKVNEDWDRHTLEENILPSYGFTRSSQSYQNFIDILLEFNDDQKRSFFRFVTGAERLPFGGIKNLNPKMTIVKKSPDDSNRKPDEYLPSVMTCHNYIKMLDYSSIDIMRERILTALKEGQYSFSLT